MFSGLTNPVGSPGGDKWQRSKLVVLKLIECGIVVVISLYPLYAKNKTNEINYTTLLILSAVAVGLAII